MRFAIDFDNTITADASLFAQLIGIIRDAGHDAVCVTARRDTPENREHVEEFLLENNIEIGIYYTSLGSKVNHMEKLGIKIDVWVDDDPAAVVRGY